MACQGLRHMWPHRIPSVAKVRAAAKRRPGAAARGRTAPARRPVRPRRPAAVRTAAWRVRYNLPAQAGERSGADRGGQPSGVAVEKGAQESAQHDGFGVEDVHEVGQGNAQHVQLSLDFLAEAVGGGGGQSRLKLVLVGPFQAQRPEQPIEVDLRFQAARAPAAAGPAGAVDQGVPQFAGIAGRADQRGLRR